MSTNRNTMAFSAYQVAAKTEVKKNEVEFDFVADSIVKLAELKASSPEQVFGEWLARGEKAASDLKKNPAIVSIIHSDDDTDVALSIAENGSIGMFGGKFPEGQIKQYGNKSHSATRQKMNKKVRIFVAKPLQIAYYGCIAKLASLNEVLPVAEVAAMTPTANNRMAQIKECKELFPEATTQEIIAMLG